MPLVLDQRLDRTDERDVKLIRQSEVEQRQLAGWLLQLREIEAAAQCGDLLRQVFCPDPDRVPAEAIARQRKDVVLLFPGQEEDQRFIGAEQLLHVLGLERLRGRQRRVIRELSFESRGDCGDASLDVSDLHAERFDRDPVLLGLRFREGLNEPSRALHPI